MIKNIKHDDHRALVAAALKDGSWHGLAVVLMAYTGARANEILRLTHKSFRYSNDDSGASIKIVASKNGNDRWIGLPDCHLARIKGLHEELSKRGCSLAELISNGSKRLRTSYEAVRYYFVNLQNRSIGGKKYILHSFRHTVAVRAFKADNNVLNVRVMLGHRSLDSTLEYLRDLEDETVLNNIHKLVS